MDQEVAGSILVVPTRAWGNRKVSPTSPFQPRKEVPVAASEAIVRIQFWESQEDSRVEYYAVPEHQLEEIQRLVRRDPASAAVRAIVEEHGRKLVPQVTIEVVEY